VSWIPGWQTTADAGWWSNFWFGASLCSLAFLGICELISHRYSERKDELAAQQQTDTQNQHDDDIARLQLQAAQAHERAAEAELKLEQLRKQLGPRQLNPETFRKAMEGKPKARVKILYVRDDPDSYDLAGQIFLSLLVLKWDVESPSPVLPNDTHPFSTVPNAMAAGGSPWGVSIVSNCNLSDENTPYSALRNAFAKSLGSAGGKLDETLPKDLLLIIVAPRR
jgi:hypothetical protein